MKIDSDSKNPEQNKNYHDAYFEHGHILLKIWQTLLMLLSWVVFFAPCVITGATYLAYRTNGKHGHYFWHYSEGFAQINLVLVLLTFALGMIAVFCLAIGYVQSRRSKGLVTKWPMYDILENKKQSQRAETFMTKRFGPAEKRQQVRFYEVEPEQNLENSQLKDVIDGVDED